VGWTLERLRHAQLDDRRRKQRGGVKADDAWFDQRTESEARASNLRLAALQREHYSAQDDEGAKFTVCTRAPFYRLRFNPLRMCARVG